MLGQLRRKVNLPLYPSPNPVPCALRPRRQITHRSYVLSSDIVEDEDIMQIHPLAALLLCAALTCTDSVLAPDSPGDHQRGVTDTSDSLVSRGRPLT